MPPCRESKAKSDDLPIVCSWYVQDLKIEYEWHNSYGILTEVDAKRLVPPAKKVTEKEARTIPHVISETEYLLQQGLITRCEGEHNSFY